MSMIKLENKADIWLFAAICAYFVMNGAQLWETAIMIPAWTKAPPASLIFFQQPYGLDFKIFWIVVHSVHEVILLLAIIFNWNIPGRRMPLVVLFLIYAGVRAWTLIYFAPTIIEFQQIPYAPTVDPALVEKAARWKNLNYLRVAIFVLVNLSLIPVLKIKKENTR